jgi:bifunctional DNase/RNase
MKKIELEIVALSHSITQTHSYAVVLGEVNGLRRLPIVIGGFEAQAIAVALEKMQPSRPLTHDLMKNFLNAFANAGKNHAARIAASRYHPLQFAA